MKQPIVSIVVSAVLAVLFTSLSFYIFMIILKNNVPAENRDIAMYLLGVLSGILTMIVSFYFGSSQSSQEKNFALMKNKEGNVDVSTKI